MQQNIKFHACSFDKDIFMVNLTMLTLNVHCEPNTIMS